MPLKVVRIFRRRVVPSAKDTLSAAIPVLKTVKAAADIANAPLVGNIASVLLVCVETAKDARSNKEDALELLARIVQLVLPTINRIHAMGFPSTPAAENLLHDMKELLPMFEQVSSAMSNITRRNLFFRFMRSVADKEKILEQRRQLDNRLQDFSYNSLVSLRMASAVAESQDYATLQQEDVELLEVEGTHKSPDDDEFRYSNIYRARLRADGTTVLLLQCKRDIAAMNFLAEVHRYHDAYHPNVVQFRGASSQTSRPRFVVVDDHPYFACAVLAPENPYGLSVRERVRLALRMVADMYSFFEYLDHNDMPTPRRVTRGYFFRFDATLSRCVYQPTPLSTYAVYSSGWYINMFQGFLSVWPEISSPSMNFDLGGKSVPALNIILSPLWNLPIASSAYDRALDNLPSVFTAIYEDWNSMTTGMTESAHCWPSLRTMLAPYFQIRDSYITSEHLPDHPTRPELGDVVYVDYPCNFPATLVTNASNYTVICNIATEIWEACNFRADADIEDSFEAPKTNKGEVLSWGFSFTDGYPTSFESTVHYDEAFPSIKTRTTPNPVHAYLSHNLEDIVTGCTGHISSGHCSVRRVFFMVTAVEHRQRYTLEARRTESPTSAIRRTSSNSHLLFHDSPYVFHRNPTETAHIDADSDTPKPWGHWSTSKDCTQGEYVIPAAPNKDAFEAMPGVELDGFRVKALAFPESERCRYKFHIFHELIIS